AGELEVAARNSRTQTAAVTTGQRIHTDRDRSHATRLVNPPARSKPSIKAIRAANSRTCFPLRDSGSPSPDGPIGERKMDRRIRPATSIELARKKIQASATRVKTAI